MQGSSTNKTVDVSSPGRINLIGEHIDYNGGLVLPGAIDKEVQFSFTANTTNKIKIESKDMKEFLHLTVGQYSVSEESWHNYLIGVLYYLNRLRPGKIGGFDCTIESHLPIGAGISSSAALECGFAKGINHLFELGIPDNDLALAGRDAEHHFVGTKCGIMDQMAVMHGKEGMLIKLDSQSMNFEHVPAQFGDYQLLLINTNVHHNLASSAYNKRRESCEGALNIIRKDYPSHLSLAMVSKEELESCKSHMSEEEFTRAEFVIEEQQRVKDAVTALKQGDINKLGQLLFQSHEGLQHKYEVSCKELDFLVQQALRSSHVAGARMMGGGFGGCTINLVHTRHTAEFLDSVTKAYEKEFNHPATVIRVNLRDGVKIL